MKYILIFCLSINILSAQEGWNMLSSVPYPRSSGDNVLVHNDTVILCGIGFKDTIDWRQGVVIAQFDTLGNLLNSNIVLDSTHKLAIAEEWGDVIPAHGGGYVITAATVRRESAFLIKFDDALNIEFMKEYPDTVNLSNFDYTPIRVDSGYVLFGRIMNPDFKLKAFIRYVDYFGETIRVSYFNDEESDIWDLSALTDSLLIAAVWHKDKNDRVHHSLAEIDLQGNIKTKWASSKNTDIATIRKIIATPDGGVVIHGLKETGLFMSTTLYTPFLMKFDNNYEIVWEHFIEEESSFAAVDAYFDLLISTDNNIIACGEGKLPFIDDLLPTGWISKYSNETGETIWSIKPYPSFPKSFFSYGDLFGVGELSSGNIMAGGEAFDDDNSYLGWLLKVTQDGCVDTIYCDTSPVTEITTADSRISLYPNPADDEIHIRFSDREEQRHIRIFDLTGKKVFEKSINEYLSEVTISTNDFSEGIYMVQIKNRFYKLIILH